MTAPAMQAIANITLNAATSSVTFSNIPQTYRDLFIAINTKNTVNAQGLRAQFNDDTASNYTHVVMYGTGASTISAASGALAYADFGVNRTTDTLAKVNILDYSASDKNKSVLVRSDNPGELTLAYMNRWASTSPIIKIKISASDNLLAIGSTFTLYGVLA